jgi:hypothetical protein
MSDEKRNFFKSKWFQKWEFGLIEGMIIGVLLISFVSTAINPGIFLVLVLQFITVFLVLQKQGYGLPFSRSKQSEESKPATEPKSADPKLEDVLCPSCGAKGFRNKEGQVWFPRHKQGCQFESAKTESK